MKKIKAIISGGGTGGHIFPAVSIADAIKKRYPGSEILFVGANDRMEMERVPAAGYKILGLEIAGFERKNLMKNFSVLWKLYKSIGEAKRIVKDFQPQIAIGVGGYASGPTLWAASKLGIPCLVQEPNSYAGITNRILAKRADKFCVANEGMEQFFPKNKIVLTGTPCRQDLDTSVTVEEAREHYHLNITKKTILILGGSLGAKTLNQSVLSHLDIIREDDVQLLWQCGAYYIDAIAEELKKQKELPNLHVHKFISRMDLAYKAADLVISRAGAGTIAELSILQKPVILVPSPNVSEDHQTKNAMALVNASAAILVKDAEAKEILIDTAIKLLDRKEELSKLSQNIAKRAQYNAADKIVDEIVDLIEKKG